MKEGSCAGRIPPPEGYEATISPEPKERAASIHFKAKLQSSGEGREKGQLDGAVGKHLLWAKLSELEALDCWDGTDWEAKAALELGGPTKPWNPPNCWKTLRKLKQILACKSFSLLLKSVLSFSSLKSRAILSDTPHKVSGYMHQLSYVTPPKGGGVWFTVEPLTTRTTPRATAG